VQRTAAVAASAGLLDPPLFPPMEGTALTSHGGGLPAVLGGCGLGLGGGCGLGLGLARLPWEPAPPRPHAAQVRRIYKSVTIIIRY
jgi:hypothetical protein